MGKREVAQGGSNYGFVDLLTIYTPKFDHSTWPLIKLEDKLLKYDVSTKNCGVPKMIHHSSKLIEQWKFHLFLGYLAGKM